MSLYDFLYWISTLQLYGNRLNILGLIWLLSMIGYTYFQLKDPLNAFRAEKGRVYINSIMMLAIAIIPVMLLHYITDEINTTIVILTGAWSSLGGTPAPSLSSLWAMKFDVYLSIILFILASIMLDLNRFFKIRKSSIVIFTIFIIMLLYAGWIHVGDFTLYIGWDRFWRFWIFYSATYILLTLLYLSMIQKKPKLLGKPILARIIDIGRHSVIQQLSEAGKFGLNAGCGQTRYKNKVNVDVDPSADVDVRADLRALPFRAGCFGEVILDEVLEHIPEDAQVLREMWRVLAPHGQLFLSVPVTGWLARIDKILLHSREYHSSYSKDRLLELLETSNFLVQKSFIYGTLPHFLKLKTLGGTLFAIGLKEVKPDGSIY